MIMSVQISLFAGAGWQLFNNDGVPLAGGKIYTYTAGTSTPQTTYTTSAGTIANSNPIILDAFGRVPNEIWLTTGTSYKFVVKTSDDVLLGTYDNIPGAVSAQDIADIYANFANTSDITKGDALVGFKQSNASGFLTGAIGKTVHQKLQELVTPQDFGAVGDGVVDDSAAIQAALNSGQQVWFPKGTYYCPATLTVTTDSQTIYLNGSKIIFKNYTTLESFSLIIEGKNVVFYMGGGTFSQAVGYATVAANTIPGGTTIQVTDSSTLYPGQTLVSSFGEMPSDPGVYPIGGPTSPPGSRRTASISGNTVTLSYAMNGTSAYLPAGLVIGEWSYGAFCSVKNYGSVTFNDGIWERMIGYYYFTPTSSSSTVGGEIIQFNNIYFKSNGLDQFLFGQNQKIYFNNCRSNQQWDTAKSGMWFDNNAFVYISDSDMALGYFDASFNLAATRNNFTDGELFISNSRIQSIAPFIPPAGGDVANSLQCIETIGGGSFKRIFAENTRFNGYQRYFLSSTVLPFENTLSIDAVTIDGCLIDSSCSYFLVSGSGHSLNIGTYKVSNTSFYQSNPFTFIYAGATGGATANCVPYFNNCYFKLNNSEATINGDAYISNSIFVNTPFKYSYNQVQMENVTFAGGSTITIAPTYDQAFYGQLSRLTINDSNFPYAPGSIFSALGGVSLSGAQLATAKSPLGSTYYNVYKAGSSIYVSGTFNIANGAYFLRGTDVYIPIGSRINDMYTGTQYKVTFNLLTTLASAASSGDTSITVTDATGVVAADKVNILLDNGLVDTLTVDGTYAGGTTIPLTSGLSGNAANGSRVNFFRVV